MRFFHFDTCELNTFYLGVKRRGMTNKESDINLTMFLPFYRQLKLSIKSDLPHLTMSPGFSFFLLLRCPCNNVNVFHRLDVFCRQTLWLCFLLLWWAAEWWWPWCPLFPLLETLWLVTVLYNRCNHWLSLTPGPAQWPSILSWYCNQWLQLMLFNRYQPRIEYWDCCCVMQWIEVTHGKWIAGMKWVWSCILNSHSQEVNWTVPVGLRPFLTFSQASHNCTHESVLSDHELDAWYLKWNM